MESHGSARSPLLYGILIVCVLGLLVTLLLSRGVRSPTLINFDSSSSELPKELDSMEGRAALFHKFMALYNGRDHDGLFRWYYAPIRREQLSKERLIRATTVNYDYAGPIRSGEYESYQIERDESGVRTYTLRYAVETEKGKVTVRLVIAQRWNEPYVFLGFGIRRR